MAEDCSRISFDKISQVTLLLTTLAQSNLGMSPLRTSRLPVCFGV